MAFIMCTRRATTGQGKWDRFKNSCFHLMKWHLQDGIDANVGPVTKQKSSVSLALYAFFLDNAKTSLN